LLPLSNKIDCMKRVLLLLVFCLTASAVSKAQGFYVRMGLGYAVPQAGQTMDGTGTPYNGTTTVIDTNTAYSLKKASFSAGLHGSVGFGYMFNNHVGVDLMMDIGLSMKKLTYNDNNTVIDSVTSDLKIVQQAKTPVMIIPSLVLQTDGDVVNLYTRIGIVLPLGTKITQDQIITNLPGAGAVETDDYNWQIKNSFALGFSATVGVRYKLSDKFSVWGEAGFLSLAVLNNQATLTGITVTQGGQTQTYPPSAVSGATTITYSTNFTANPNDYSHQPAFSQPFSNFNFTIGCTFALGGHHKSNGGGFDNGGYKRKSHSNF